MLCPKNACVTTGNIIEKQNNLQKWPAVNDKVQPTLWHTFGLAKYETMSLSKYFPN